MDNDSIYFFGMIGAAIYYLGHAKGLWKKALGLLKAIVWPAMLVYKLLK
jgi:hypothetical protein